MGSEFKDKGTNIALGPMMNILRVPQAGRNFEGFGADPFLAGECEYFSLLLSMMNTLLMCCYYD